MLFRSVRIARAFGMVVVAFARSPRDPDDPDDPTRVSLDELRAQRDKLREQVSRSEAVEPEKPDTDKPRNTNRSGGTR